MNLSTFDAMSPIFLDTLMALLMMSLAVFCFASAFNRLKVAEIAARSMLFLIGTFIVGFLLTALVTSF